jgi:hypothetical protein
MHQAMTAKGSEGIPKPRYGSTGEPRKLWNPFAIESANYIRARARARGGYSPHPLFVKPFPNESLFVAMHDYA